MSCTTQSRTLLDCIYAVCRVAESVVATIGTIRGYLVDLLAAITASKSTLSCVINGPVGGTCDQPLGGTLPTLAERLDGLNAASVASVTPESAVATAGQTVWTLSSSPDFVDVALNGATLTPWEHYTLAGDTLTFVAELDAGDEIAAWKYML